MTGANPMSAAAARPTAMNPAENLRERLGLPGGGECSLTPGRWRASSFWRLGALRNLAVRLGRPLRTPTLGRDRLVEGPEPFGPTLDRKLALVPGAGTTTELRRKV